MTKKQNTALDYRKKNRRKIIRTIMQTAILLALGIMLYTVIFDVVKYQEPDQASWNNDKGFIALSYFGVGRSGTPKLIAKKQLDEQLQALYDQGYVTISQQDIIDFYEKKKSLPDKALFLSFEDGRNDSSLFAQPALEKYNYKATILSYANKMGNSENKFLQPKDMLKMMRSGFWEMGTNGYRLTYINVFDNEGRFVGVKDEGELSNKTKVGYYNHYLMDFIRDHNMIPIEDRSKMEERIHYDYKQIKDIYSSQLGFVPGVYMIMHANTLYDGMNRLVSDANDVNIKELFKMHFNREGNAYNDSKSNLYDLTRVQPAPYWYTNHLLMRIQHDTGQKMKFVRGDEEHAAKWDRYSGTAEFMENKIALTSPPGSAGMLYLKNSASHRDLNISAKLEGNVIGKQTVYVRYDRLKDSFIRIVLHDNKLTVEQKQPKGEVKQLFTTKLSDVVWNPLDLSFDRASVYTREQGESGAPKLEEYPINIQNTRQMEIALKGDSLRVTVDKEVLLDSQKIDSTIEGGVALEAEYSEVNKKDDIYDGVFTDVKVASPGAEGAEETVLFTNIYTGFQGVVARVENAIDASIDWVIDTF
ncbi:polysaccharide deacetylase family protein [Brevibacillus reuszeri]|uniref:polysaccharide deacetylase family protein n=1 Tax=Brevibacillus reuszeri TaxID=54915 RepID=UPI001BB40811|nr:polysaccharide deacetylase family protein [Brevibacillus reuszeri]